MADELFTKQEINEALNSPEVVEAVERFAEQVKTYWQSIAPVGDPNRHTTRSGTKHQGDPHPGQYRDSIVVERRGNTVYVVAKDPKANLIEYGSIHNSPYAPRARTAAYFAALEGTNVRVSAVAARKGPSAAFKRIMAQYPSVPIHQPSRSRRKR